MKWLGIFALAAALPVTAQEPWLPHKLVIVWYQSNLTVIDYPSKARCEAAAKAVNEQVARKVQEVVAATGARPVITGPNEAFCIPG